MKNLYREGPKLKRTGLWEDEEEEETITQEPQLAVACSVTWLENVCNQPPKGLEQ